MPTWTQTSSIDFTNRAAQAAVGAGQALASGVIDVNGGIWSQTDGTGDNAGNGRLRGSTTDGSGFLRDLLLMPDAASGDQRIDIYFDAIGAGAAFLNAQRYTSASGGNYYLSWFANDGGINSGAVVGGAIVTTGLGSTAFVYAAGHEYLLSCQTTGTSPTHYAWTLSDVTANAQLATVAFDDSDSSRAVLHGTGKQGVGIFSTAGTATVNIRRIDTFGVQTGQSVPINDPNILLSPYNWLQSGSAYAKTNNPGAYCRLKFTGTSIAADVDVSGSSGDNALNYATILYRVDGSAWTRYQLQATGTAVTLASGLSDGTHEAEIVLIATSQGEARWATDPAACLKITGFSLDQGATTVAPSPRSKRVLIYWDSNGEGLETLGLGSTLAQQDASQSASALLGRGLNAEYGVVAFAGQGYTAVGGGGVPPLPSTWNLLWPGQSRLSNGAFTPAPDYILSLDGENDWHGSEAAVTEAVRSLNLAWRAAAPLAKIAFIAPPDLQRAPAIQAGVIAAADANTRFITSGINLLSTESGLGTFNNDNHLNPRGHAYYAALILTQLQQAFGVSVEGLATALAAIQAQTDKINGIIALPFAATVQQTVYAARDLPAVGQGSAVSVSWTLNSAMAQPIDLTGKQIRFVLASVSGLNESSQTVTGKVQYDSSVGGDAGKIGIGGTSHNVVTVNLQAADTGTPGGYRYFLWNITDNQLLARGDVWIKAAVKTVAA